MKRLTRAVCNACALSLFLVQIVIPWTAHYYVTMDGPSHLYNARVISQILFQPSSPYREFYRLRPAISTNWGSVLLFNLVSRITTSHAEAVVATLSVLAAFSSFWYLLRALDPEASFTPVINFLTLTWFLWVGFYNFYLGMALFAFATGYYLRHSATFSWRNAGWLAAMLVTTFFTHILPSALAILVILVVALWLHGLRKPALLVAPAAAVIPTCLLLGSFVLSSHDGIRITPDPLLAWRNFPARVFAETFQRNPSGTYLYPVMLGFMLLGILLLKRIEWSGVRGAVAAATGVCFALYLVVPARGFGGDDINSRVAWAVFILGSLVAASGSRMQKIALPVALYATGFLSVQLYRSMNRNVRNVSHAIEDYARATEAIPEGARVVRIHFNTVPMSRKYGFRGLSLDPMYHADSWMAARRGWVDLSDYQALSRVFALELRPPVSDLQRGDLWNLESGDGDGLTSLHRLLDSFPHPIQYVLVLGNTGSRKLDLDGWSVVGTAGEPAFLEVFRRPE